MIEIEVNNQRKLKVRQDKEKCVINVVVEDGNQTDNSYNITDGDFVMLLNYYRYVKSNNVKCDFINP